MIEHTTRPLPRRALMVDDELAQPASAGGRAVRAFAEELRARGVEVIEALSCEDRCATVVSDSAIHLVCVNWTLGLNDRASHDEATELLRKQIHWSIDWMIFLPLTFAIIKDLLDLIGFSLPGLNEVGNFCVGSLTALVIATLGSNKGNYKMVRGSFKKWFVLIVGVSVEEFFGLNFGECSAAFGYSHAASQFYYRSDFLRF